MTVRPAKTQISLGIRPVKSESSLSAWRKFGSLATHWAHSKDSDQTRLGGCPGWSESSQGAQSFWRFCHVAAQNIPYTFVLFAVWVVFLCVRVLWFHIWASSWDYGTYRRPAKAQASLRIPTVSPEPSLFIHMKYRSRQSVRPKSRHLAPLDDCAYAFEECVYGGRKVP